MRVLEPGEVGAGDAVARIPTPDGHPTVVELMDTWYERSPDPALLRRLLAAPLAARARADVARKLALATV